MLVSGADVLAHIVDIGEDKAELLAFLDKGIISTSYFALSAMLEHRAQLSMGVYRHFFSLFEECCGQVLRFQKTSADMLDGNADGVVLMRCASRLFEKGHKACPPL